MAFRRREWTGGWKEGDEVLVSFDGEEFKRPARVVGIDTGRSWKHHVPVVLDTDPGEIVWVPFWNVYSR